MSSIPQFSAPQDLPNTIISYERLRNFTLLRKFKSVDAICILASARLINVKDTAVVVTIEDTVYQFGEDCDGLLYFTEIQSLSARRLKDVVFGRESTWFGISDDGKAYVWGGGSHLAPTHILQNLKIIQVDAMGHQIICLTSNGQVWISRDPLTEFLRIPQENFCGESIASVTSVTCGSSITGVALSAKGVVRFLII
ncbi:uncharacterized protein LOC118432970 [Folsomia candida]|uniref:uncharacterized protein LOC118432970 n=1 Tax=Folsomia candida TaxID=158441 RepID=UPI0016053D29|nr:uncharacterized protein LOC118432970 [Folsomia candida]